MLEGKYTNTDVATAPGMHPCNFQRHLRNEFSNFESIKDEVRHVITGHFSRKAVCRLE